MARRAGLGYVPEERMRDGVIGDFSVAENLMLVDSDKPAFARLGFLRRRAIRARAGSSWRRSTYARPDRHAYTEPLGGNIQSSSSPESFPADQRPSWWRSPPGASMWSPPLYS